MIRFKWSSAKCGKRLIAPEPHNIWCITGNNLNNFNNKLYTSASSWEWPTLTNTSRLYSVSIPKEVIDNTLLSRDLENLLISLTRQSTTLTREKIVHQSNINEYTQFKSRLDEVIMEKTQASDYDYLHMIHKYILMRFIEHRLSVALCDEMYNKARLYLHQARAICPSIECNKVDNITSLSALEHTNVTEKIASNNANNETIKGKVNSSSSSSCNNDYLLNGNQFMERMYFSYAEYLASLVDLNSCYHFNKRNIEETLFLVNTSLRVLLVDAADDLHHDAHQFSSLLLIAQNLVTLRNLISTNSPIAKRCLELISDAKEYAMLFWLSEPTYLCKCTLNKMEKQEEFLESEWQESLLNEEHPMKTEKAVRLLNKEQTMWTSSTNCDEVMQSCVKRIFTNKSASQKVKVKMLACYLAYRLTLDQIGRTFLSDYVHVNNKTHVTTNKSPNKYNENCCYEEKDNEEQIVESLHRKHIDWIRNNEMKAIFPLANLVHELIACSQQQDTLHSRNVKRAAKEREEELQEYLPLEEQSVKSDETHLPIRVMKTMLSTLMYTFHLDKHYTSASFDVAEWQPWRLRRREEEEELLEEEEQEQTTLIVRIVELLLRKLLHIKERVSSSSTSVLSSLVTEQVVEWEIISREIIMWLREIMLCHQKLYSLFTNNKFSRRLSVRNMQRTEQMLWKLIIQAANNNLFMSDITNIHRSETQQHTKTHRKILGVMNNKSTVVISSDVTMPSVMRELILPLYGPAEWKRYSINEFIQLAHDWNLSSVLNQVFYVVHRREKNTLEQLLEEILKVSDSYGNHDIIGCNNNNDNDDNDDNDDNETGNKICDTQDNYKEAAHVNSCNNDECETCVSEFFVPSLTFGSCVLLLQNCWNDSDRNFTTFTSNNDEQTSITAHTRTSYVNKNTSTKNATFNNNTGELVDDEKVMQRKCYMAADVIRYTLLSLRLVKYNLEKYSNVINTNGSSNNRDSITKNNRVNLNSIDVSYPLKSFSSNARNKVKEQSTDYFVASSMQKEKARHVTKATVQAQQITEQLEWVRNTAIPRTSELFAHAGMPYDNASSWTSFYERKLN